MKLLVLARSGRGSALLAATCDCFAFVSGWNGVDCDPWGTLKLRATSGYCPLIAAVVRGKVREHFRFLFPFFLTRNRGFYLFGRSGGGWKGSMVIAWRAIISFGRGQRRCSCLALIMCDGHCTRAEVSRRRRSFASCCVLHWSTAWGWLRLQRNWGRQPPFPGISPRRSS